MYRGKIVETGPTRQIFDHPHHPYTQGLLACRPQLERQYRLLPMVSDFLTADVSAPEQTETPAPDASASNLDRSKVFAEVSLAEQQERLQQLTSQTPLLDVHNLRVLFPVKGAFGQTRRHVAAVNDVSFQVFPGETLGLVGESGCGKTTLGRALLQLVTPSSGKIWFDGIEINQLGRQALRRLRRDFQIIFQDPYSALDPRMRIGAAIMEPLKIHQKQNSAKQLKDRVIYLLERVGLQAEMFDRYPHEFSGGQRQRICIARALALNPRLIICDESVSALDVSVQAQVLNLLKEIQAEFNLTYIFISHDLSVVKFMSDRIMVMNRGKIEEVGPAMSIYQHPQSDYTRQLIAAIPAGVPA
jgi:peptide/nickel transport system ATP-binding protein